MAESQIFSELKTICQKIKFYTPENKLPKIDHQVDFPLTDNNPLSRGKTIERLLTTKIILGNLDFVIHRLNCNFKNYSSKIIINRSSDLKPIIRFFNSQNIVIPELIADHVFPPFSDKPDNLDIPFYGENIFKAKYRCLTQPTLGFCLPDVIIDDKLIDIKTDISNKDLKKYLRQVFIQSLLYELFIKSEKRYSGEFSDSEIQTIDYHIESIGVYYWKINEFYQFELKELIDVEIYQKLLRIYLENEIFFGLEMRNFLSKSLFVE